jgi:uroporphyrinogen-III synthase
MKKILYTGLDPSNCQAVGEIVHSPFIQIIPKPLDDVVLRAFKNFSLFTHLIITSKSTIPILKQFLSSLGLEKAWKEKIHLAVGKVTAVGLAKQGINKIMVPSIETAEGIVEEMKKLDLSHAHVFFPHSSLSRPVIHKFLHDSNTSFHAVPLYETHFCTPEVDINLFDEVIFTSPSTVNAYFEKFGCFEKKITFTCIGPVTKARYLLLNN